MKKPPPGVGVAMHVGARDNQEDYAQVRPLSRGVLALALADGMGGHAAGEVASRLAVETFLATVTKALPGGRGDWEAALRSALLESNAALTRAIDADPECDGMGCTLIGVLTDCERYALVSMGDSPALISGSALRRVNTDHSMRGAAERQARATGESLDALLAQVHPSALTSALVGDPMDLDALKSAGELDLMSGVFAQGERMILASDGVESLGADAFDACLRRRDLDAPFHAQALVEAVLGAGDSRQDNICVVVLDPAAARRRPSGPIALIWLGVILFGALIGVAVTFGLGLLPVR